MSNVKVLAPVINIKAQANQHAFFLMLLAIVIFLITLSVSQFYWHSHHLVLIFIYLIAIVVMLTGLLKRFEPRVSVQLTPQKIQYNHRHGKWNLNWQQIQAINTITEVVGLSSVTLPYVGIRLENIDTLAEQISPRLANRLIHEQRPLLSFAVRQRLLSIEETPLNFEPFTLRSGKIIKGPKAAFLHHCQTLKNALGYHLYIPEQSMDRELEAFCQLLKQCQHYSVHYPKESSK